MPPIIASSLSLLLVLTAATHAQWVHFHDRSADRLVTSSDTATKEKDCAVGDFDRDGWPDVVVVTKTPFSIAGTAPDLLLMNRGGVLTDETATLAPQFLTVLTDARDVWVTDIDADGWPDLIVANTFAQQPVCYRNRGDDAAGTWLGFVDESAARLPFIDVPALQFCAVCAGDIDGDGSPDLYFSNYVRAPDIALDVLLLNDGTGHFTDASQARLGDLRQSAFGTSVDLRDIDNDGDLDIIKTSSLSSVPPWNEIGLFVLFNDGTGNFQTFQPVPSQAPYMFIAEDFDNDGRLDFFVVNDAQDFAVRNAGPDPGQPGQLLFEKTVLLDSPRTIFLGGNLQGRDLDNDGDLDVAITDVDIDIGICETSPDNPRKFALLRNEGDATGTFVDPWGAENNTWNRNVYDVATFDIDRDGKLDFFLAECSGYSVLMQENTLHTPTPEVAFGEVVLGSTGHRTLRLCNNGTAPATVTAITSSSPHFAATDTSFTLAPFECRDIALTFAAPATGAYTSTLSVAAGPLSREIALTATSLTPPEFVLDTSPIHTSISSTSGTTRSIPLSNTGGSPLGFEVRLDFPGATPDRVLLTGDPSCFPVIEGILTENSFDFTTGDIGLLSGGGLEAYDTVILALSFAALGSPQIAAIAGAARSGKTVILVGGTPSAGFRSTLRSELLGHIDSFGWKQPAAPHFQLADPNHPLSDGLPTTHDFNLGSAAWYLIHPDDPDAWVAATNGDGAPCLLSKPVGAGTLVYFTNWPLSAIWNHPDDRSFMATVITNGIGYAKSSWLSVSPRTTTLPVGGSGSLDLAFNAVGKIPGDYAAHIVITTNDPGQPEITIPVTLEITPAQDRPSLALGSIGPASVTLVLSGQPGTTYELQHSTDTFNWTPALEVQLTEPSTSVVAPLAPGATRTFFRTIRRP